MKHAILAFAALACLSQPAHAADLYDKIDRINYAVNKLPLTNCKSYSWEKMARLEAAGIPADWIVVETETGGYHAIVVVDGRWALDSRRKRVVTIDELRADGYRIADVSGLGK